MRRRSLLRVRRETGLVDEVELCVGRVGWNGLGKQTPRWHEVAYDRCKNEHGHHWAKIEIRDGTSVRRSKGDRGASGSSQVYKLSESQLCKRPCPKCSKSPNAAYDAQSIVH